MARYIDADRLIEEGWRLIRKAQGEGIFDVIDITDVSTADVEEVKHGEWDYIATDEETAMTIEECGKFKNKADYVEVVRCKECKHSINFDKNCSLNRTVYRHCQLWRGEELTNVWHRYKKYYKDYSIVELDGYCDSGERKDTQ